MKTNRAMRWAAAAAVGLALGCGGPAQQITMGVPPPASPDDLEFLPYTPELQSFTEVRGVPEYVLGAGDVMDVMLRGLEPLRERVSIRADGNISFGLVENVRAAGRTITELDEALTQELRRFLRDPKLDIEVAEYKSKMVSLQGAIQALTGAAGAQKTGPGRYPLKGKVRVLDLILEAGGTNPDAQFDRVQLIRGGLSYRLNIQRVLNTGDQTHNVVLQAEDFIFVPGISLQSKKVVVLGEVRSPNVYVFPEDVSFLEALGQAGGLTETAIKSDIRIIRNVEGAPQMFALNYEQVVSGSALSNNIPLESNDIIFVPRSFIGDLNDAIAKINPLLDLLLIPATYRDLYTTGAGLRLDTGSPPGAGGGTTILRTLGKAVVSADSTAKPVVEADSTSPRAE